MTNIVETILIFVVEEIHKQVTIHIKIHSQIMITKQIQIETQIKIQILQSLPTLLQTLLGPGIAGGCWLQWEDSGK